jgi:hypothetical protein
MHAAASERPPPSPPVAARAHATGAAPAPESGRPSSAASGAADCDLGAYDPWADYEPPTAAALDAMVCAIREFDPEMRPEKSPAPANALFRFLVVDAGDRAVLLHSRAPPPAPAPALVAAHPPGFLVYAGAPASLVAAWRPGCCVTVSAFLPTARADDPEWAQLSDWVDGDRAAAVVSAPSMGPGARRAWLRDRVAEAGARRLVHAPAAPLPLPA